MKTQTLLNTALATLLVASSGMARAHGGSTDWVVSGPVIYTNAAYALAIHGSPNPAPEVLSKHHALIYTDQAYGQAIHSYPQRGVPAQRPNRRAVADNGGKTCADYC